MSKQFMATVKKAKSKRQQLDDYLTYSPRTKPRRGFYTTYHAADGKETLEKFVDDSAMASVDKFAAPHKEEIRKLLGETRQ